MLDKGIFRQYDIRGVVPDNFNRDIAKLIGNGIGRRIINKAKKNHLLLQWEEISDFLLMRSLMGFL